jgi:hypothetical protein
MLKDTAPGAPLPSGCALQGIRPPMEGAGGDAAEVPDAKPPKPFKWVIGQYMD